MRLSYVITKTPRLCSAEASKAYFGGPVCETIVAGDINGDCKVDFADFVIMAFHWLE